MTIKVPKNFTSLVIVSLVFVLGTVVGFKANEQGWLPFLSSNEKRANYRLINVARPSDFEDVDFGQFWDVWRILERDYYKTDNIDEKKMTEGAIGGMTSALGDPYTVYLPPEIDKRAAEDLAGAFYGIGIELGYIDNTLAVVAPLKGTPAAGAGIRAGDLILHVTDKNKNLDEDTTGWSLNTAVERIRGPKGSEITLTLYRKDNGAEPFDITVKRGEIIVPSVEVEFSEKDGSKVAHLILSRFGERTDAEWDNIVNQILNNNSELIVLDMRNNPGGYFDSAVHIASEFITDGKIVSQKGKSNTEDFKAEGKGRLVGKKLVILVNKGSASASEIVAGALRDRLGAKLVGQKTFGKGTVQDRRELPGGGGLHVTVAEWLLPGGSNINKEGLSVDSEIEDNRDTEEDEMLDKAIEVGLNSD